MGKYFGTDGFRGEFNKTLLEIHAYKIGNFLAQYYKKGSKFVIGRDTRISGTNLENALVKGICDFGADAYILGVTTTPSVAYLAKGFSCGIMISASHNPYYDNGIKLINNCGEKMDEAVIEKLEEFIDNGKLIELDEKGKTIDFNFGKDEYINHLYEIAPKKLNLKIGFDLANGSATGVKKLFDMLGYDSIIINDNPDGKNINNNCGSTHMEGLSKLVMENNLDLGFAYDGDADRCLFVNKDGSILSGDHILYICGKYLKSINKLTNNTVVTTVMSNFGLYKALDDSNINYAKTAVGDKYVYEYMKKNDCIIGGEQSGHIIFKNLASTGDGILTSLKLLEVLEKTNKSIDELIEGLKIYPQTLINIKVKDKNVVLNDEDVLKAINDVEKKLDNSGRILVRPSGTEPLIRVMVEAQSEEVCKNLCNSVINVIVDKGYKKED